MYIFYSKKDKKLKIIDKKSVIDDLYYLKIRLPTKEEIKNVKDEKMKKYLDKHGIDGIKKELSNINLKIPLYDAYNENLYIINRNNVYERVVKQYYRLPTDELLQRLIKKKNEVEPQAKKIDASLDKDIKKKLENMSLDEYDVSILKYYKKYHRDVFLKRKYNKLKLMIEFLRSYDLKRLHKTYVNVFYHYANEVGKNITLCNRPSFLPHFKHIIPYYTRSELINMALNMELIKPTDKYYDSGEIEYLCKKVSNNDINSKIIFDHQLHIIKNNKIGIVKYYSIQGSYFMNKYMRHTLPYPYKDKSLEKIILSMWELINSAPKFDKSYIVYRFIKNDSHLNNLKIGDEFIVPGFLSTTRNPFYSSEVYKFGYILLKIKIPGGKTGVALCIESMSHFPKEEEIILPPLSILKLVNRDENVKYYHTDINFIRNVNTIYEFVVEGKKDIKFADRPDFETVYDPIDFLKLKRGKYLSIGERIKQFIKNNVGPMYKFDSLIGEHKFTIFAEWYDSTKAYKKFYRVTTSHGFSIYSINASHMDFFIEIGEDEDGSYMYVNYYLRFATTNYKKKYTNENFITFLSKIAHYFEIQTVVIFADYFSCDLNNEILGLADMHSKNIKIYYGGNFCIDYYNYLKYGTIKYKSIDSTVISPGFSYYMLDKLKEIKPSKKLLEDDNNELFQIYDNAFKLFIKNEKDMNMAKYFIWIVEHHCYLIDDLIRKLDSVFKDNSTENPFDKNYYILDPEAFLYNMGMVQHYVIPSKDIKEDTGNILTYIPKNKYRLHAKTMRNIINSRK